MFYTYSVLSFPFDRSMIYIYLRMNVYWIKRHRVMAIVSLFKLINSRSPTDMIIIDIDL